MRPRGLLRQHVTAVADIRRSNEAALPARGLRSPEPSRPRQESLRLLRRGFLGRTVQASEKLFVEPEVGGPSLAPPPPVPPPHVVVRSANGVTRGLHDTRLGLLPAKVAIAHSRLRRFRGGNHKIRSGEGQLRDRTGEWVQRYVPD